MATPAQWLEGARPRTLPAAVAPVLAGTGIAVIAGSPVWWKAAVAMVVSLALQIGVNYANDYSDGVRGTDKNRVGPLRLVGSGAASPSAVKAAAFASFGVACVAGLALAVTTAWWLVAVGAVSVLAAWLYTGGPRPYGYTGLGEVMVFVFFGLVAVMGTTYVQTETWSWGSLVASVGVGALACAILVANNLRDIPTDKRSGKHTLAVLLGDERTRGLFETLIGLAVVMLAVLALVSSPWLLLGLVSVLPATRATKVVREGARGPALIPALQLTGMAELLFGAGIFVGAFLA